ncbi:MAG: DNA integrity scanning protein DisA nucleotide-binding domain protein [Patescibacteria group bacterium]
MGTEAIQHYFSSGWQALSGQANFSWSGIAEIFNLITLLDILIVLLILWWVWNKIKRTALAGMIPKIGIVLLVMFLAKLFGLIAVFYTAFVGLLTMFISIGVIYHQDLKKLWDSELAYAVIAKKSVMTGEYDTKKFLSELSETVITLAKSHTPALLVIRTDSPLNKLIVNSTPLYAPFSKEFVWDIFAHRSKLSAGAMIIDRGVVIAAGSTLTKTAPKRFLFNLNNSAICEAAREYNALIIITHKDKEDISLLHKDSNYTKLSPNNLDRMLKTILLG